MSPARPFALVILTAPKLCSVTMLAMVESKPSSVRSSRRCCEEEPPRASLGHHGLEGEDDPRILSSLNSLKEARERQQNPTIHQYQRPHRGSYTWNPRRTTEVNASTSNAHLSHTTSGETPTRPDTRVLTHSIKGTFLVPPLIQSSSITSNNTKGTSGTLTGNLRPGNTNSHSGLNTCARNGGPVHKVQKT